jgi:hypothetical protein
MLPYEEISDLCKKSEDIVKKFIQKTQIPNNSNPYNHFIDVNHSLREWDMIMVKILKED